MFFSCGWCYKYKTAVEILWNFYQTEEENELVQSAQGLKKKLSLKRKVEKMTFFLWS